MSAALNVDLFKNYFGNCPFIHVSGSCFNVKTFFLEDVLKQTGYLNVTMKKFLQDTDRELFTAPQNEPQSDAAADIMKTIGSSSVEEKESDVEIESDSDVETESKAETATEDSKTDPNDEPAVEQSTDAGATADSTTTEASVEESKPAEPTESTSLVVIDEAADVEIEVEDDEER